MEFMSFEVGVASKARVPKSGKPYAMSPFRVQVACVAGEDVVEVASGTPAWARGTERVHYVLYGERTFRRVEDGRETDLETEVKERGPNSAVHEASVAMAPNRSALYEDSVTKMEPDLDRRRKAENLVLAAAADSLIVDGKLYRAFHEPTWIVTRDRAIGSEKVLLQPFFGVPGQSGKACWFRADRRAEAEAFARGTAGGGEVMAAGTLELDPFFAPGFDDVAHAARNAATATVKGILLLGDGEAGLVTEAMSLVGADVDDGLLSRSIEIFQHARRVLGRRFDDFAANAELTMSHASFMDRLHGLTEEDGQEIDRMLRP